MPEPHMKSMIVDRSRMFFGTGNFTENGFNDARELFAVTDDRRAISQVLQMAASFLHGYQPERRESFGLPAVHEPWVVLENTQVSVRAEAQSLPHTEIAQEPWLLHYRKVDADYVPRLKECGLDHLLLIPEADFMACGK